MNIRRGLTLIVIVLALPQYGAACLGMGVGITANALEGYAREKHAQSARADAQPYRESCEKGDQAACIDYQDALSRARTLEEHVSANAPAAAPVGKAALEPPVHTFCNSTGDTINC